MKSLSKTIALAVVALAIFMVRGDIPLYAGDGCDTIIGQLDSAIKKTCWLTSIGYACYGNYNVEALPSEPTWYGPGASRPVESLEDIRTTSDDGIALMLLETPVVASPVRLILFGSAEVGSEGGAFVLSIKNNREICEASPPALVAFTESGIPGVITVNGVTIELQSVVFITMKDPDSMAIANINGNVTATALGTSQVISESLQSNVRGISTGRPAFDGLPTRSKYYDSPVAQYLAAELGKVYDPNTDPDSPIPACGNREIALGEIIDDEIHDPGQECLYTFCATQSDIVTAKVDARDRSLDPYMDLRGPDLTWINGNNDRSGTSRNSLICNQTLASDGCYTIMVRSNRNQTKGPFRLTLEGKTDCTDPACFCRVINSALNQRNGPGMSYTRIGTLRQGTVVDPLACSFNKQWLYVSVQPTDSTGWIWGSRDYVDCEPCVDCGISVTAKARPASIKEPGGVVTFDVKVANTGSDTAILKSVTLNPEKDDTQVRSTSCLKQGAEPQQLRLIPGGDPYQCAIEAKVQGVANTVVVNNVLATAEASTGKPVSGGAPAPVKIIPDGPGPVPTISAALIPNSITAPDCAKCVSPSFMLEIRTTSKEVLTLRSLNIDGFDIPDKYIDAKGNAGLGGCVPGHTQIGGLLTCGFTWTVCRPQSQVVVTVTAKDSLGRVTEPAVASATVQWPCSPAPTPCVGPKCGPFLDP